MIGQTDSTGKRVRRRLPVLIKRNVPTAPLPINYEAAKRAIAECARVDECEDWADKAAAIASYARQREDKSLLWAAQRIRCRAEERLGELLLEIPLSRSGRGQRSASSRYGFAEANGVTSSAAARACRIARLPKQVRDQAIEASPPCTIYQLASLGRPSLRPPPSLSKQLAKIDKDQIEFCSYLHAFLAWAEKNPAAQLAQGFSRKDGLNALRWARQTIEWLDEFEQRISAKCEAKP